MRISLCDRLRLAKIEEGSPCDTMCWLLSWKGGKEFRDCRRCLWNRRAWFALGPRIGQMREKSARLPGNPAGSGFLSAGTWYRSQHALSVQLPGSELVISRSRRRLVGALCLRLQ